MEASPRAASGVIPLRPLALVYRLAAAAVAFWGIALVSRLFSGAPSVEAFKYFTVLSNVLCLVWLLASAARTERDWRVEGPRGASTPSPRFAAAVAMAITVTMLIYLVVLLPQSFNQPGASAPFSLTDTLVHVATPLVTILDWLLFVPKGHVRVADPLLWALIPLGYLALAFVASAAGMTFSGKVVPYPFMNVAELGVGGVAAWVGGLTVVLEGVAYLYFAVDRWLGRRRNAGTRRP